MKKLQRLCAATSMLVVLSVSAVAGDITTNVVSPPPPPPAASLVTEPSDISTSAGEMQITLEAEDVVTQFTLSLLQLLSAF